MNKANDYYGFKYAYKNVYIEILEYLCKIFKDPEMNECL